MVPSLSHDICQKSLKLSDDSDSCYDSSDQGFGGPHIYGGIIYSDSNGMNLIDGDYYSSSPITQNLATLPTYVPDVEYSTANSFVLDSESLTNELTDLAPAIQYQDMSNYPHHHLTNNSLASSTHQPQYHWNHAQVDDVNGMTSSQPTAFLTPNNLLHHHQLPPHLSDIGQSSNYAFHASSSVGPEHQHSGNMVTTSRQSQQQQQRRSQGNSKKQQQNKPQKPKGTPGRKVKVPDYELTPAEARKRHIRRERNKIAAAKCRNRRRELAESLQKQTEELQKEFHQKTHEERRWQQEKEYLEYILEKHAPSCKLAINSNSFYSENQNQYSNSNSESHLNNNSYPVVEMPHQNMKAFQPQNNVEPHFALPLLHGIASCQIQEVETPAINTPVCTLVTPSQIQSSAFTFPSTSTTSTSTAYKPETAGDSPNTFNFSSFGESDGHKEQHQTSTCSTEHHQQSSSSSESLESNCSPNLLAL